jgi:Fe2+ or Zn2+ uptake regulation protein
MAPVTEELMQYWIEHPDAQGTEEVIAEWWLLEHRIRQVIAQVRENLKELVERNFVIAVQQADGRVRYRLNREKDPEIRKWLESGVGPEKRGGRAVR